MAADYSLSALLKFLDYLGGKGLVNRNTIVARKAASNKMLSILDESESEDLRDLDLNELAVRFANKQGTNYAPESLQVYKSRLGTALSDFFRYKENPSAFKIENGNSRTRPAKGSATKPKPNAASPQRPALDTLSDPPTRRAASIDVPVSLRPNCIIQMNGIPVDLTPAEARKISNVIMAMVAVSAE